MGQLGIGGTVSVIDVATASAFTPSALPFPHIPKDRIQPVGMRLTRDGRYAFWHTGPANHVAVVDAKTIRQSNICWSAAGCGPR